MKTGNKTGFVHLILVFRVEYNNLVKFSFGLRQNKGILDENYSTSQLIPDIVISLIMHSFLFWEGERR